MYEVPVLPLTFHTDPEIERAERELLAGHPPHRQDTMKMKNRSCIEVSDKFPADLTIEVDKLLTMFVHEINIITFDALGGGRDDFLPQRATIYIGCFPEHETKFAYKAEEAAARIKEFLRDRGYSCRIQMNTHTPSECWMGGLPTWIHGPASREQNDLDLGTDPMELD